MTQPRSVVITGASRGLGFASAVHLYRQGWRVVAAMRNPETGLPLLRDATGAAETDARLVAVPLDLEDPTSIELAAKAVEAAVGAPDVLVHNAGISAAGAVEETPMELWHKMFAVHVFGPVALTKALLPSMRMAGRGRIVVVSSQGGVRGIPAIAAYSAAKGALERWAESLALEVAPFGLGVTVLVTGTFDTDIITDAGTTDLRDFDGAYARHHATMDRRGRSAMRFAAPPRRFAVGLAKALDDRGPFTRHAVGPDARMLLISSRVLPSAALHQVTRLALGLPRQGAVGNPQLALSTRLMIAAARVVPAQVMLRLTPLFDRKIRSEPHGR